MSNKKTITADTYLRMLIKQNGHKAYIIIPQIRKTVEPYKSHGVITHEIEGIETTDMVNNVGLITGAVVKTITGKNIEILTVKEVK